ncbi:MAG: hypothetical protein U9O66_02665, partial [Patescibacteria group bacterium]|nr:hypothetical protein [Patescibacteria group bacterium]
GAAVYYFYELNNISITAVIIITYLIILKKNKIKNFQFQILNFQSIFNQFFAITGDHPLGVAILKLKNFLILIYSFLIFILFKYLFIFQTTISIRSPWQLIPNEFFIFYFLATLILLIICWKSKTKKPLILISAHFFLNVSVALIIYPIGYGFDQFIHQATEKVIVEYGAIYPKPLYYLGQYSLVVFLSKIFSVNYVWIDKLLVPIMFALFLPTVIYNSFRKAFNFDKNISLILTLFFLILPFGSFIVSTPQNLANIFVLIIIFAALPYLTGITKSFLPLIILCLAVLSIHPIAGIATSIFLFLIFLLKLPRGNMPNLRKRKTALILFLTFSSIIFPAIFLINSKFANLSIKSSLPKIEEVFLFLYKLKFYFVNNFNPIFDFAYFYKYNFYLLIFFPTVIIALVYSKKIKYFTVYFFTFFILLLNFLILNFFLKFEFLINYEKSDYTQRVGQIAFYFLIPILFFGVGQFLKKIKKQKFLLKIFFLIFACSLVTVSFYLSYPRADDYETSHSFNISNADIAAARWIENDARGENFIVLANQQVSAAAIREFGFKKYYGNQFYYPIPTSSPLYQYYLKMVNDAPKKEYAKEAMQNIDVQTGYFVINKYWWRFQEI